MTSLKKQSKAKFAVKANNDSIGKPVAAVERALSVLNAFRHSKSPLWLHEIAEKTGLYKSTVLRLLETLQSNGYIIRITDGRYQLGAVLFELGSVYQASFKLETHVLPVLENLSDVTGESATFYIRNGNMRQCMWRVESPQPVRDVLRCGQMLSIGNTSSGQVFKEHDNTDKKAQFKDFKGLVKESSQVDDDQTASISCPVYDAKGFIGAMAISGPVDRFSKNKIKEMKNDLAEATMELSQKLGFSF